MPSDVARLFDAMAADYDVLEPWYAHLYDVLHALLRARLPPGAGRRALDAGCGSGLQGAVLDGLGYAVHGVDVAPALLRTARLRLPAAGLALATIEALPYRDASFEVATCCGSTLSFVDAPAAALAELARVLRPGGQLLLECEHRWSLDLGWALASSLAGDPLGYGLTPAAAWRQLVARGEPVTTYPGYGRLRLFRVSRLRQSLLAAGLTPQRVWGVHGATNLLPSTVLHRPRLSRPLAGLFRALCAIDAVLRRVPGGWALANSVVVLAGKGAPRG